MAEPRLHAWRTALRPLVFAGEADRSGAKAAENNRLETPRRTFWAVHTSLGEVCQAKLSQQ